MRRVETRPFTDAITELMPDDDYLALQAPSSRAPILVLSYPVAAEFVRFVGGCQVVANVAASG